MATVFTRQMPNTRLAVIEHGDTIQSIAGREMGDANRWPELAWINDLRWPYVTDDPDRAGASVLLAGGFIRVPAAKGFRINTTEIGQVFERDCALRSKRLEVTESGDFAVVAGAPNLTQQLTHRLVTPRGQMSRHPKYGSLLYRLIGKIAGPSGALMARQYADATIRADYRIKSMKSIAARMDGESIKIEAIAETIAGGPVDIKTDL